MTGHVLSGVDTVSLWKPHTSTSGAAHIQKLRVTICSNDEAHTLVLTALSEIIRDCIGGILPYLLMLAQLSTDIGWVLKVASCAGTPLQEKDRTEAGLEKLVFFFKKHFFKKHFLKKHFFPVA